VESLPSVLPEVAVDGADIIRDEIESNIARGVDPNGRAWPATDDGHAPLADAMKSVTVKADGVAIHASVKSGSVEERHHLGKVRGGKVRQIIPTALSASAIAKMDAAAQRHLAQHMEGES
jgi:hypothetical protein